MLVPSAAAALNSLAETTLQKIPLPHNASRSDVRPEQFERRAHLVSAIARGRRPRAGNGILRCRDRRSNPPFCLAETDAETGAIWEKPAVRGTNARITRGVRYLKTGWWCAQSDTNRSRRPSGLISALLQGIFADTGLFRESAPCFGSDDQRLTGKFPTFVNRGIFSAIRPSSRDNSRLLRKIRQAPKQPFLARGLLVQHPYHTDGRGFTRKIRQSLDPISANRPFPKPMAGLLITLDGVYETKCLARER
jgi:hypothetical protein